MPVLVLLVEDEPLVALPIEDALIEAGYQVDYAQDGDQALKVLERASAEIAGLITDIRLGGKVSGWEIARRDRELNPHIPVVYCSADSNAEWQAQGVPHSIMIAKPFALGQLTTAISQLLNDADPEQIAD